MVLPPIPSLQPTTMTHVEYQRVQHALPDGTPDPAAKDNFYIRATGTWYLVLDSDRVAPDASGTKHVHVPGLEYRFITKFEQKGRLRGKLRDRFTEIYPDQRALTETGHGTIGAMDEDLPAHTGRRIFARVRTIVEHVETHAEGRHRVTCTTREAYWCVAGGNTSDHLPFVPTPISGIGTESKPPVRPTPPVFGYGLVSLPRDDDF